MSLVDRKVLSGDEQHVGTVTQDWGGPNVFVEWDDGFKTWSQRVLVEPYLIPTETHEGEYARNQREAIEHIETLPPSERSAVANRPGQTPPSTPETKP